MQLVEPTDGAKEPAVHTVQFTAPTFDNLPAGQVMHWLSIISPAVLPYLPAGHSSHSLYDVAPIMDRNRPAAQREHTLALT